MNLRAPAVLLAAGAAACGPTQEACDGQADVARLHETGIAPLHLVAADFDGDAHVDVVAVGTLASGAVVAEIHRGEGDGELADPQPIDAVGCSAYPVAGDLDGDARAELVYPDCEGDALIFWGGPAGPGAVATHVDMPFVLVTSAIDDADGDGRSDLIALGGDARIATFHGDAERSLVAAGASALATALPPSGVRTGDLDGDGVLDAVTWTAGQPGSIALARGLGDGSFAPAEPRSPDTAAASIALGSLDDRGGLELVALAPGQHRLVIDHADASGRTTEVPPYRPALAAIADLGGDLGPRALVIDGFDPEVRYYAVGADGALIEDGRLPTPHAAQLVLTPDVDGDGVADVLVGHLAGASFSLWLSSEWI